MSWHSRRRLLLGLGTAITAGLAGCDAVSTPSPEVIETEQALADDDPKNVTVRVLVENTGASGRVRVTVRTYDANGNQLEFFGRIVEMDSDERRRLEFNVRLLANPARFDVTAEAV